MSKVHYLQVHYLETLLYETVVCFRIAFEEKLSIYSLSQFDPMVLKFTLRSDKALQRFYFVSLNNKYVSVRAPDSGAYFMFNFGNLLGSYFVHKAIISLASVEWV